MRLTWDLTKLDVDKSGSIRYTLRATATTAKLLQYISSTKSTKAMWLPIDSTDPIYFYQPYNGVLPGEDGDIPTTVVFLEPTTAAGLDPELWVDVPAGSYPYIILQGFLAHTTGVATWNAATRTFTDETSQLVGTVNQDRSELRFINPDNPEVDYIAFSTNLDPHPLYTNSSYQIDLRYLIGNTDEDTAPGGMQLYVGDSIEEASIEILLAESEVNSWDEEWKGVPFVNYTLLSAAAAGAIIGDIQLTVDTEKRLVTATVEEDGEIRTVPWCCISIDGTQIVSLASGFVWTLTKNVPTNEVDWFRLNNSLSSNILLPTIITSNPIQEIMTYNISGSLSGSEISKGKTLFSVVINDEQIALDTNAVSFNYATRVPAGATRLYNMTVTNSDGRTYTNKYYLCNEAIPAYAGEGHGFSSSHYGALGIDINNPPKDVVLPDFFETASGNRFAINSIDDSAFCVEGVETVTINPMAGYIGDGRSDDSFANASTLQAIYVPEENTGWSDIDGVLFNKNKTELRRYPAGKLGASYTIPDSVTYFGGFATGNFAGTQYLKTLTLPNNPHFPGPSANVWGWISTDTGIETINIPANCGASEEAPEGWSEDSRYFDEYTMSEICKTFPKLKNISIATSHPYFSSESGVPYNKNKTKLCGWPSAKPFNFNLIPATVDTLQYVPASPDLTILDIPGRFKTVIGCSSDYITQVRLQEGVENISSVFDYCNNLESVTIPSTLTSINGEYCFRGCNKLKSVYISDLNAWFNINLTEWQNTSLSGSPLKNGADLYLNGSKLTTITVPEIIKSLNYGYISYCTSVKTVNLPTNITSLGSKALAGCTSLNSISLPETLTSIGSGAFTGCTSLTNITIPSKIKTIEYELFMNCTNLRTITLPAGITEIDSACIKGCPNLTNIIYKGTTAQWEAITKYNREIDGPYWWDWNYGSGPLTITCTNGTINIPAHPNYKA